MGRVILDTSVVLAAWNTSDHNHSIARKALLEMNDDAVISVVTLSECLVYAFHENKSILEAAKIKLKNQFQEIFEIDETIAIAAAQIRSKKKIKIGDALIGATSIVHDLELWTFDKNQSVSVSNARLLK